MFIFPFLPSFRGMLWLLLGWGNLLCGVRMKHRPAMAIWLPRGTCQPPGDVTGGVRAVSVPPGLLHHSFGGRPGGKPSSGVDGKLGRAQPHLGQRSVGERG